MHKVLAGLASLALTSSAAAIASASPAQPSAPARPAPAASPPANAAVSGAPASDELVSPLEAKRRETRDTAIADVLNGTATPQQINGSTVVKVADASAPQQRGNQKASGGARYVELSRERTDKIFVVLAEFGNQRDPNYPDQDTDPDTPGPEVFDGPLHNQIPAPNRAVDNSTNWQADYNQAHYQDIYFGSGEDSVKSYYEKQSSGRYSVDGTVTNWVKVPYNEARYGRSGGYPCAQSVCANVYDLVRDGVNAWVDSQHAAGRSDADIAAELATFDEWDRYDHDADGNFNEPDGYIDHFQIVHAGGDEADGDPHQGEDAIWSHRAYAYQGDIGVTGPASFPAGGTEIGDTGLWVGDYTMQPENGGVSVFVHEYGHDLGLPDDYDTSGEGDNSQEYWTLMAQSRLNAKDDQALGTKAGDLGSWNKLQLGWLDYEVVNAGQRRTVKLGNSEFNNPNPQAVIVTLPDKEVTHEYGTPYAGQKMFWSDMGNDLSNTLTATLPLSQSPGQAASVDAKVRLDTEEDYDFLYAEVSTDGQATWVPINGTFNGQPFGVDDSGNPALSGSSGGQWGDLHLDLSAYTGQDISVRFEYRTDGGLAKTGVFVDDITLTVGANSATDGAEGTTNLVMDGWKITTGTESATYPNFYIGAKRSFVSYDQYLATGPYNFGFPDRPDWVEHYAYQEGLLLTYVDQSSPDNNTNEHPGTGRSLNIDSHPMPIANLCGTTWRTRIQVYDATFSKKRTPSMTLHCSGRASLVRSQAGQPVFDDRQTWWYAEQPNQGVKVPINGVRIEVRNETQKATTVEVSSTP